MMRLSSSLRRGRRHHGSAMEFAQNDGMLRLSLAGRVDTTGGSGG